MMLSRLTVLSFAGAALIACGSKGGGGESEFTTGPEQPGFSETEPPSSFGPAPNTFDQPARNPQQPASNPNAPSGGNSPPGGGGTISSCTDICTIFAAKNCDVGDPATCVGECTSALAEAGPCIDELIGLYSCLAAEPSFMCTVDENGEPGDIDIDDIQSCEAPIVAYIACAQGQEQPMPAEVCTLEGDGCEGCTDPCDVCECAGADPSLCGC